MFIKKHFIIALERPPLKLENHEVRHTRRSKLQRYVDILKVLAHRCPLKLTHIMHKSNINCNILKEYMGFLIKQGLVEKQIVKKSHTVFAITQRGITVLRHLQELTEEISAFEET